jgi:hypothetical protein
VSWQNRMEKAAQAAASLISTHGALQRPRSTSPVRGGCRQPHDSMGFYGEVGEESVFSPTWGEDEEDEDESEQQLSKTKCALHPFRDLNDSPAVPYLSGYKQSFLLIPLPFRTHISCGYDTLRCRRILVHFKN